MRRSSGQLNFGASIGKKPIHVRKEVVGHVANRLQAAIYREVVNLIHLGVVDVADADTAVCWGPGLRWGIMGPSMLFLELSPMIPQNTSWGGTAFTVSVDAKDRGVTTGISAYDRAQTVLAIADPQTRPEGLARPGHIFPLRARRNGVLERRGHTEAAVDLARLAGLNPAGVICEIANDDGTMACVPDLVGFCGKYALKMVSIADLARYRNEI